MLAASSRASASGMLHRKRGLSSGSSLTCRAHDAKTLKTQRARSAPHDQIGQGPLPCLRSDLDSRPGTALAHFTHRR